MLLTSEEEDDDTYIYVEDAIIGYTSNLDSPITPTMDTFVITPTHKYPSIK